MGTQSFARGAFVAVLAALLSAESRATIVVDASGGGAFTSLQAAIDAAGDGEQIFIKAGTYVAPAGHNRIQIVGKGLSIVAETGAVVYVPGFDLVDVPEGHWVMARGLTLWPQGFSISPEPTVNVTSTGGTLVLEECSISGKFGQSNPFTGIALPGSPAVRVAGGGAAILQHCVVQGGGGAFKSSGPPPTDPSDGGAGIEVTGGRVAVYGGTVTGGNGGAGSLGSSFAFSFPDGGDGVQVSGGGFIHLAGTVVTGGSNGDGNQFSDDTAGDGLHLLDASSSAWVRDSQLAAGSVAQPAGTPGLALNAPPGTVTSFSAPARDLTIDSPLREGQPGTLTIHGEVGDLAYVVISIGAGFQPLASRQGVLLLDSSALLLPVTVGVITSPSGTLTVPFVTPQLNPLLKGLTVPMQLAVHAGGVTTLESATLMGWLDSTL